MRKTVVILISLLVLTIMFPLTVSSQRSADMTKKNLGSIRALYPMPITVIGAEVDGKVNWLMVGHVGILGQDRVLVSMNQRHYTNHGIVSSKKLSINLISRDMLKKADYVGCVSGAEVDKSDVFEYHFGENGSPMIDASPLVMECDVVEIYHSEGYDNFICTVANTYAEESVLDEDGKLDYHKLKPVLFEFPTYSYLATGEVIGKCRKLDQEPSMTAKAPLAEDGIIRISKIEIYPEYLNDYKKYASEEGEISLRTEPGVVTMYAVSEKENPYRITILETYSSEEAYKNHIDSPHFKTYKQATEKMVKSLDLIDQLPLNQNNILTNYIQ